MGVPLLGGPVLGAAGGLYAASKMLQHYERNRQYLEDMQSGKYIRVRADGTRTGPGVQPKMATRTRTRTLLRRRTKRRRRIGKLRRPRRIPTMWPASQLVKMRVVTSFSETVNAGALKTHTLFWNTLNDPLSGLSNQLPLGMDQYAALYSRYCIVGARAFVKVHNVSSTGAIVYGLTSFEPSNTTVPTTHEGFLELPHTRSRMLSPDMDHSGLGLRWSAKRAFKVKNLKDASELHGELSLTPTSPTKAARFYLWYQDINKADNLTMEGFVTIEFIVLLMDRINPARSTLD